MPLNPAVTNTPGSSADYNAIVNMLNGAPGSLIPSPRALAVLGLLGAVNNARLAGATPSGPPVAGTFGVGDFVLDQLGRLWFCITAGTPGIWKLVSPINFRCSAFLTAAATPGVGDAIVPLDTVDGAGGDPLAMFAAGPHTITVPVAGTWLLSGRSSGIVSGGAQRYYTSIFKAAAELIRGNDVTYRGMVGGVDDISSVVGGIKVLAAGDVLTLHSFTTVAVPPQWDGTAALTFLSVHLLSQ